jgi:hypothetical protein
VPIPVEGYVQTVHSRTLLPVTARTECALVFDFIAMIKKQGARKTINYIYIIPLAPASAPLWLRLD